MVWGGEAFPAERNGQGLRGGTGAIRLSESFRLRGE